MRLPPEIHQMLFAHLDGIDRLCLLLTCKYFTRVGSTINREQHYIRRGRELMRLNRGFCARMPNRLNLCTKCGIMRPKDPSYWEPHRCGWNWRKLIPSAKHRVFAEHVNAWSANRSTRCPRCFEGFFAQGNLRIGELPVYGNNPFTRKIGHR